jgi:hypothetical protein
VERSGQIFKKLSFAQVLSVVFALAVIVGFAIFVLSGATTNRGTVGAITSETAVIKSAEKLSCQKFGTYGTIATLQKEGLLAFKPVYNSVVYLPGSHCGTIVIGSPSYQTPVG